MQKLPAIFLFVFLCFLNGEISAQDTGDSLKITAPATDTVKQKEKRKFDPRIATKRSAMVPGWGQIYNRKYWKLPLVYGSLGITAGVFFYNVKNYKLLRLAYSYRLDKDSANDALIDPRFRTLSTSSIRTYRNAFRQNVDYSVLFFIVFWGLNVVDATVDGHLKQFDVNDNLTVEFKPGYSSMANTAGLSLVMDIHSKKTKTGK